MDLDKIKEIFETYSKKKGFSGVALIRDEKDDLFSYAHGYAHRGFKILNTLKTRFDTASITKLFTSLGIFLLIDKGLLSLQDKALDILQLPELKNSKISNEITIYHLLTHTSGIGDDADEEAGESYEALWIDKPNYSVRKLIDFLPNFIYKEPNFKPGEGCRYNNCAYVLLGLVIEKLSKKIYQDFIEENIFLKLGMKNSNFLSMDDVNENAAEGYTYLNENTFKKNIYSYPPIGTSDGGAYSTVHDLDIFIRKILHGEFLKRELTDEILKPKELYRKKELSSRFMGYGFEFELSNDDNKTIFITKDGSNAGVACVLKYYPKSNVTFTILSNVDCCNIWALSEEAEKNIT